MNQLIFCFFVFQRLDVEKLNEGFENK